MCRAARELIALVRQLVGLTAVVERHTGVIRECLEQRQIRVRPFGSRSAPVTRQQRSDDGILDVNRFAAVDRHVLLAADEQRT